MLNMIGLVGAGFIIGVLLTAIIACYFYGVLHQEAVRALESYGGLFFHTNPARSAPVGFPRDGD